MSLYLKNFIVRLLTIIQGYKWNLDVASQKLELPNFQQLIYRFLYDQSYPNARIPSSLVSIDACPLFDSKISVFYSASAIFRAPSDPSGLCSMCREYIRANPTWRKGQPQYDCVFINAKPELPGMQRLEVARVFMFFSFVHRDEYYPCALVQWFSVLGDEPDDETGLWMVEPDIHRDGEPYLAVIHLDSIYRAAHLIPVYHTSNFIKRSLTMHNTLDEFKVFFINKFVDHHAFEIAS